MLVYINGEFFPREKAVVSVFDHGYLYGDGIYETLRAYGGAVFRLDEHARRLARSAERLSLRLPFDAEGMSRAVYDALSKNGLDGEDKDAYIRVTVSRGPGELGLDPDLCPEPTTVIIAKELKPYPPEIYENGIKVSVVTTRRNPPESLDPAIKSTNFLNNIFAKIEAKRAGAYEGIMLNHDGHVTEGTVSNVFIVKGGELFTAPASSGILLGVTREFLMGLAKGLGMAVREEPFTATDMLSADEVFLTNTTMEVMPVTDIDGHTVSGGKAGNTTRRLRTAYGEEVRRCLRTR